MRMIHDRLLKKLLVRISTLFFNARVNHWIRLDLSVFDEPATHMNLYYWIALSHVILMSHNRIKQSC